MLMSIYLTLFINFSKYLISSCVGCCRISSVSSFKHTDHYLKPSVLHRTNRATRFMWYNTLGFKTMSVAKRRHFGVYGANGKLSSNNFMYTYSRAVFLNLFQVGDRLNFKINFEDRRSLKISENVISHKT